MGASRSCCIYPGTGGDSLSTLYYCDKCEFWVMEGADNGPYEQDDSTYICQGCYASQLSTLTHQEPESGAYDENLVSKFDLDNTRDYTQGEN